MMEPDQAAAPATTGRQRGVALVLVLWVIALLSVMALAAVSTSRTELHLVNYRLQEARMRALADAAVSMAVLRLRSGEEQDHWYPDGTVHPWSFAGYEVDVRLYNESSRVAVNSASELQLQKLIGAAQLEGVDVDAVVAALLDWRDPDQSARPLGAEDGDYRSNGLPYGAKDGALDSVAELGLVLGLPRELGHFLEPHLTVYTQGSKVQMEYASPLVRAALSGEDPLQALPTPAVGGVSGDDGAAQNLTHTLAGPIYRIRVSGDGPAVELLVRVGRGAGGPVSTIARRYDWRETWGQAAGVGAEESGTAQ